MCENPSEDQFKGRNRVRKQVKNFHVQLIQRKIMLQSYYEFRVSCWVRFERYYTEIVRMLRWSSYVGVNFDQSGNNSQRRVGSQVGSSYYIIDVRQSNINLSGSVLSSSQPLASLGSILFQLFLFSVIFLPYCLMPTPVASTRSPPSTLVAIFLVGSLQPQLNPELCICEGLLECMLELSSFYSPSSLKRQDAVRLGFWFWVGGRSSIGAFYWIVLLVQIEYSLQTKVNNCCGSALDFIFEYYYWLIYTPRRVFLVKNNYSWVQLLSRLAVLLEFQKACIGILPGSYLDIISPMRKPLAISFLQSLTEYDKSSPCIHLMTSLGNVLLVCRLYMVWFWGFDVELRVVFIWMLLYGKWFLVWL